jgi:N6-L-threonylcarbamoyladenine synthase
MMNVAVGFDTSCYTTSVAAVSMQGEVVAFARKLLPVEAGQRGLRQSEAVFAHVRQMPQLMTELQQQLEGKNVKIVAVCASARPCDGKESYMPVFTVGLGHARTAASLLNVPLYETTHQRGHIAAGLIGNPGLPKEHIALHLSGGTTDLLYCGENKIETLGSSLDLHAGQLVDRIGVKLGMGFPAGPSLEKLALSCVDPAQAIIPCSMENNDLCCHLSGAETKVLQLLQSGKLSNDQAALEVFDLLSRIVARMLLAGCKKTGLKHALVVGGVASSGLLRSLLQKRLQKARSGIQIVFGDPRYSADNAAGVAAIGMQRYMDEQN